VGPVWHGGHFGEKEQLVSCYRKSLALAQELGCRSVAFPLISGGVYGYPKSEAVQVAIETMREFLADAASMTLSLVVFDAPVCRAAKELYPELCKF